MADDNGALKQVNRSGFPFQLKVEHEVRSSEQSHHWSVASRERRFQLMASPYRVVRGFPEFRNCSIGKRHIYLPIYGVVGIAVMDFRISCIDC